MTDFTDFVIFVKTNNLLHIFCLFEWCNDQINKILVNESLLEIFWNLLKSINIVSIILTQHIES